VATAAVHSVSVAGNLLPTLTKIPRFNQRGIFNGKILGKQRRAEPVPAKIE
jgi:hypothetical protein